ncbi:hypothetical protein BDY19DRAFT_910623 [Irpex rosettiformis]|uniref:Uncharacterized protein n=1 Tax=Irpex rosettiformis TaxID=378272 RepID=A0ACB8TN28_9APHY|nr:hypothetical protein BDY19DRAFT_910623 [Irpex rosettiformis]
MSLLHVLCTTSRQKSSMSNNMELQKQHRVGTSLLILLGERSQQNSYFKHIIAMYLYATGASRQTISVAAHLGVSSSYTAIAASNVTDLEPMTMQELKNISPVKPSVQEQEDARKMDYTGSGSDLESTETSGSSLSDSGGESEESEIDEPLYKVLQMKRMSAANKLNTHMNSPASAPADSTATPMPSSKKQHCKYTGLLYYLSLACREAARLAAQKQILGRSQAQENGTCATIFPLFNARREDMKTKMLLDSISKATPLSLNDIILTADEQALHHKCQIHTVLRVLLNYGGESFGRFKKDIANCTPRTENTITLHKTEVYPLPAMNINESSITSNAEVMEAIFDELKQSINDPECKSLEEYLETVTFEQLYTHASELVDCFASSQVAMKFRAAHASELRKPKAKRMPKGDAVLFMRDAMLTFALSYRGCGRTKYAYEMLHVIHNLTHVWPKPLRKIVLDNWLVNTTGFANSFLPLDLLQEHMNFWIKTIYNANGSNASWDWLGKISPCFDVLRQLATHMNSTLGSRLGQKHHSPELTKDICKILESLCSKAVYEVHPGRTVENNATSEVTNIVASGLQALSGPLRDYNEKFDQLHKQYHEKPLIGNTLLTSKSSLPSSKISATNTPTLVTSMQRMTEDEENDNDEFQLWGGLEDTADVVAAFTLENEEDFTLDME